MEQKIPFTSYDFWAYLSCGFMFLFAVDQAAGTLVFGRESWTVVNGVLLFAAAYAVGQLLASIASLLLERCLVGQFLGYPRELLLAERRHRRWLQFVLPEYCRPLPAKIRQRIQDKADAGGVGTRSEDIFWAAHSAARSAASTAGRLDNFLNLYGFCRNCAMVGLANGVLLYWSYWQPEGPPAHLLWARLSLVLGIGMTFRYLKFFRTFCIEVMTAYAFQTSKASSS